MGATVLRIPLDQQGIAVLHPTEQVDDRPCSFPLSRANTDTVLLSSMGKSGGSGLPVGFHSIRSDPPDRWILQAESDQMAVGISRSADIRRSIEETATSDQVCLIN